ncbi:MAG: ankyrin repeat domain-containing protein [Sedimenticola sp.]|nr:ankyrin repeat domain-containing protein [Sedimenticola sp.]
MKRHVLSLIYLLTTGSVISGCSPEQPLNTEQAIPPIISAAETGDSQRIAALLTENVTVDTRDSCHWTPLMKASLYGHANAVDQLVTAGAQLDLTDKGGYSALMLASSNNHASLVKKLLAQGANPNMQESTHGWTALIWAAKRGHLESVTSLIQGGAAIEIVDFEGKNARSWAIENRHNKISALLNRP